MISELFTYKLFHTSMAILELTDSSPTVAHTEMLQYPTLVLNGIPGLRVTDAMAGCLCDLGDEAIGPQGNYNTSGQYL